MFAKIILIQEWIHSNGERLTKINTCCCLLFWMCFQQFFKQSVNILKNMLGIHIKFSRGWSMNEKGVLIFYKMRSMNSFCLEKKGERVHSLVHIDSCFADCVKRQWNLSLDYWMCAKTNKQTNKKLLADTTLCVFSACMSTVLFVCAFMFTVVSSVWGNCQMPPFKNNIQ